jgi:hypothetical protein
MVNKKLRRLYAKLIILVLCFLIIARIFVLVLSKYESISNSYANVDIAFYLLKEDYKSMTLNLASLLPQDNAYTYEFSIGNQAGEEIAEVDLEYELSLRTTTNLPLTFELYMNQSYTDVDATNIIKENTVALDEHGTYFRTMTTEKVTLPYTEGKTNLYQLVVYFPENYNQEIYQDIIELLEINVNGQQVT